jgi:hypothetical protein
LLLIFVLGALVGSIATSWERRAHNRRIAAMDEFIRTRAHAREVNDARAAHDVVYDALMHERDLVELLRARVAQLERGPVELSTVESAGDTPTANPAALGGQDVDTDTPIQVLVQCRHCGKDATNETIMHGWEFTSETGWLCPDDAPRVVTDTETE